MYVQTDGGRSGISGFEERFWRFVRYGNWLGGRVEAHVMVAFLGYCLWGLPQAENSKQWAPTLTPLATAGSVQAHSAGGSLVQTEGRRGHLPATNHSTGSRSSDAVAPTELEFT